MKEYKYKLFDTINKIISFVIIFILSYIYIAKDSSHTLAVSIFALFLITILFAGYYQIKFDRMYRVLIDRQDIIFNINKGWISEEIKMLTDDVTRISCYRKYIIFKKLYISTRYQSVTLNIRNFNNYKEMLRTIVEKTENNKNIRIDQTVYDMIK